MKNEPQSPAVVLSVTDLRIEPRELADRGVRYIKVPAALLLDQRSGSTSDIHPSDLSDLLGRFGIDLIAERIEGERAVVDLLDYDVRFGIKRSVQRNTVAFPCAIVIYDGDREIGQVAAKIFHVFFRKCGGCFADPCAESG